jgi:hypothetical protein
MGLSFVYYMPPNTFVYIYPLILMCNRDPFSSSVEWVLRVQGMGAASKARDVTILLHQLRTVSVSISVSTRACHPNIPNEVRPRESWVRLPDRELSFCICPS